MPDKHTMQDHIDDLMQENIRLMQENIRLRQHNRDLETQVRQLEAERDQWQLRAQST